MWNMESGVWTATRWDNASSSRMNVYAVLEIERCSVEINYGY